MKPISAQSMILDLRPLGCRINFQQTLDPIDCRPDTLDDSFETIQKMPLFHGLPAGIPRSRHPAVSVNHLMQLEFIQRYGIPHRITNPEKFMIEYMTWEESTGLLQGLWTFISGAMGQVIREIK